MLYLDGIVKKTVIAVKIIKLKRNKHNIHKMK